MNAVRLVALRETPLDVAEVLAALDDPSCGGVDLFIGRVRDHDNGSGVTGLVYEAHPGALAELQAVAEEIATAYPVGAVAVAHRVGALEVGDLAVVLGTAASHRGAAFDATRALIDTLKERVPIWKNQRFVDGSSEWVGLP
jgi:molybdopterin synthase catalytic subunit